MGDPRKKVRIAVLDLYAGQLNQGMRCIRELISRYGDAHNIRFEVDVFEVRQEKQVPDLSYHIYISTGGPGSPLESEGSEWEAVYFSWLGRLMEFNRSAADADSKRAIFICHSYELVCRHYQLARVCKRKSAAFGVFPVTILPSGAGEPIFEGLNNPFYALESRSFQVISPDRERMQEMGATVLALEKERPHVPLERAVVAMRFNKYMVGTQFHPEADAEGTSKFLRRKDKKKAVIEEHGEEKWKSMLERLNDPDKIKSTYSHILPNFLRQSIV